MKLQYGWFSEKQARLSGTWFYIDKDGNEIEVSSVSGTNFISLAIDPNFEDMKFVGMVQFRRYRKSDRIPSLKMADSPPEFKPTIPDFKPFTIPPPSDLRYSPSDQWITQKQSLEELWSNVSKEDTIESYKTFLRHSSEIIDDVKDKNKNYDYFRKARKKIDTLSWEKANSLGDILSYLDYIDDNPTGDSVYDARKRIEELAKNDPSNMPIMVFSLQRWHVANYSSEILLKIGWQPQNDRERIHLFIAQRKGYELRKIWEITKSVLLQDIETKQLRTFKNVFSIFIGFNVKDIESKKYKIIENALYAFIGIGKDEIIPILIKKLNDKGNKITAEAYLNCGHADLNEAARDWAKRHGYEIKAGEGAHPVS